MRDPMPELRLKVKRDNYKLRRFIGSDGAKVPDERRATYFGIVRDAYGGLTQVYEKLAEPDALHRVVRTILIDGLKKDGSFAAFLAPRFASSTALGSEAEEADVYEATAGTIIQVYQEEQGIERWP